MRIPTFHYRQGVDGAIADQEPENPWLRRPQGIPEQLLHGEAMHQIQEQLKEELLATRRYIDLKPLPGDEKRLADLYAKDRTAPSAEVLLREVAERAEDARNRCWSDILDRLERTYRSKGG